ncbi:MAG: mycofactocin oligosaccharide methyltransferase MftM [Gordonia sp. (in: high G+C Gram-positive bacteria)]
MSPIAPTTSSGIPTGVQIRVMRRDNHPAGFTSCGHLAWRRSEGPDGSPVLEIVHPFTREEISDNVMVSSLVGLVQAGVLAGQWEFEEAAVAMISSSATTEESAWAAFYDNSLRELRSGIAQFGPVHRRALSLIDGPSMLEVGCCFGFLALQCAEDGHEVAACDISPGAIHLLTHAARRRGTALRAVVANALDLPFATDSVDTVTLIHLVEHLSPADITIALREALRVARRRVVVAVPFEEHPSEHFGHLVRLTEADLNDWAATVTHAGARIFTDHGGWLVLTPLAS